MGRLTGKVAIVTGGARGMGAAHARRFIREGASVVITDLLEDEGAVLATELGDKARFLAHDVTDAATWDRVVAAAEEAFGPVDILVNNAGIGHVTPLVEMSEAEYRKVIDINQVSVFLGMKAVVPSMRRAGGGSIVNISSLAGIIAASGGLAYSASKFAVRGMTKAGAIELAPDRIRVNSVHPGVIATPMTQGFGFEDDHPMILGTPMHRAAQPEEVTSMVLYLASDESSFSTGAEFIVDGGFTAA
ncbi:MULTISPECIES: glucose 1-dehydrogenase [unclassified Streptomyces]|uniref:glucose 1-dehydrogenase n=1 Tax=unclassified Streptomyces TaxID=2593676 RepID=UPI002E0EA6A6|nr:glucose 1-dehydrogenase [Streptomyces sp. NBC_01197]WSR73109.1 glucose 1-dehydrogenase [Streptomyces sp. NBC_01197]WSS47185.1 glucose 1-dehydrogenase [Streptomyces sp. NBC_01180]WSS53377.1 glucose 1-dehydrogenase [Streptomyces sp. NBC_01180]